jgi:membrane-associated phospholipid phosphatase
MWKVSRRWTAAAVFAMTAAAPGVAAADAQPSEAGDGRRTLGRLPANLGLGIVGVFHADNMVPLLAGATATAGAALLDEEVKELGGEDWGDAFETGGGPIWSSALVLSLFTAGRFADGRRFRAMSYDLLSAAVVNLGYTELIKVAVGRERPNGEDEKSFPSGHTSNAFALASVVERHYGWKLGLPAYALAAVVGASRIEQDKHHLSDVFAGATLGYLVGTTIVRVNDRPLDAASSRRTTVGVAPVLGRGARGLRVSVTF